MTSAHPKVAPPGKTRIIIRTADGKVLSDTLVDNGSTNIINLTAGLQLGSVESKP